MADANNNGIPDEVESMLDRRVNIDLKSALIGLLAGVLMGPVTLSLLIRWFPSLNFMEDMMVQQYCGEAMQAMIIENVKTTSELQNRIEKLEFEICVLKNDGNLEACVGDD
jgi:hypothetical protein